MPTHLGGDYEPTPSRSMEDHLAKANHLSMKNLRVKGSSFDASTDRKTSLLRDRPARRAVKRAYRIWVSDAAHHCVQLRIDLLFTMSDNLHRVIGDRRDTNSSSWTSCVVGSPSRSSRLQPAFALRAPARQPSSRFASEGWWSQTGSNRRPPACKAGALPTELWPRLRNAARLKVVGLGRLELPTSRLSSARSNQLSYKPNDRPRPFSPGISRRMRAVRARP
jgi:hypothetical protein